LRQAESDDRGEFATLNEKFKGSKPLWLTWNESDLFLNSITFSCFLFPAALKFTFLLLIQFHAHRWICAFLFSFQRPSDDFEQNQLPCFRESVSVNGAILEDCY
jgi:hypothetical protein